MVLRITQEDKEKKRFPLAQIVGRAGIRWELEFHVDEGWVDIYVPVQQSKTKTPYVIEVETGYDFNCSEILRKFERFRKAIPKKQNYYHSVTKDGGLIIASSPIPLQLCVVIPKDFTEFVPLFRAQDISVFVWEGILEWKCKDCGKITSSSTPWRPEKCSSCSQKKHPLSVVGLSDFRIKEVLQPS